MTAPDLTAKCEWLAEHLLGWERCDEWWGSPAYCRPVGANGEKAIRPPDELVAILLTWNGAGEIVEAMRPCRLKIERDGDGIFVQFSGGRFHWNTPLTRTDPEKSIPDAIVNAAYAALQGEDAEHE